MSDLISRQAAIDAMFALCDTEETLKENPQRDNPHIDAITDAIDELPSVEPERKTGHWEWDKRAGEYVCSECGCNPIYEGTTPDVSEIDKYKFCRWCGAKMAVEIVNKHMRRE